jgi:hypothetical protein
MKSICRWQLIIIIAIIGIAVISVFDWVKRARSPANPSSAPGAAMAHPAAKPPLLSREQLAAKLITKLRAQQQGIHGLGPHQGQQNIKGNTTVVCTQEGCTTPESPIEAMRELIENQIDQFSDEELALLEKYSAEGLHRAVIDAEQAYLQATPQNRREAQQHYNLTLNLVAKLSPPLPEKPKEVEATFQEYQRRLKQEENRLAKLSPAEAQRVRAQIKEELFNRLENKP